MRADLEKYFASHGCGRSDSVLEHHRLAHIASPIIGIEILARSTASGNRGDHRYLHRFPWKRTEMASERFAVWLHLRTVKRVVDAHWTAGNTPIAHLSDQGVKSCSLAGDHGGTRTVYAGDRKRLSERCQGPFPHVPSFVDDGHFPLSGRRFHKSSTQHYDTGCGFQGETSANVGGCCFSDAVTED